MIENKYDINFIDVKFFDIKKGKLSGRVSEVVFHKIDTEREYTSVFTKEVFTPINDVTSKSELSEITNDLFK